MNILKIVKAHNLYRMNSKLSDNQIEAIEKWNGKDILTIEPNGSYTLQYNKAPKNFIHMSEAMWNAQEFECAMMKLDEMDVPRSVMSPKGNIEELSIVGRIMWVTDKYETQYNKKMDERFSTETGTPVQYMKWNKIKKYWDIKPAVISHVNEGQVDITIIGQKLNTYVKRARHADFKKEGEDYWDFLPLKQTGQHTNIVRPFNATKFYET